MDRFKIATSRPIDSLASRVTSKGESFETKAKFINLMWDVCPQLIEWQGPPEHDLTGKKCSRLTVIGYYAAATKNQRSSTWVVRCSCGKFETRKGNRINKWEDGREYMCMNCQNVEYLKRHTQYRMVGHND